MKKQNISVKNIADMARTSTATVSRVINQNGRFSKETEERVLKAIAETGYQPNQLAKGLRASHSGYIGILVPDIANEFYSSITKEIQKELLERGFISLICNTNENQEQAGHFIKIFESHNVDGIIYIGNNMLGRLPLFPIVYVDRDPRDQNCESDLDFSMIECDNIYGGYLAGRELVSKGCRKIAYVTYDLAISNHRKRFQGIKKALGEANLKIEEGHIFETNSASMRAGFEIMERIFRVFPETDGIFFGADVLAMGAMFYLSKHGISIPDQIKIVGFDDLSMSSVMGLTTIRQPVKEMGRAAVSRIIQLIAGEKNGQQKQRLPVELIVRQTT